MPHVQNASPPSENISQHGWMNTAEAARWLGVHPRTLTSWARSGIVRALSVGKSFRFSPGWLTEDLKTQSRRG